MLFLSAWIRRGRIGSPAMGIFAAPARTSIGWRKRACCSRTIFSPHIPTYPGHTTLMTGKDIYAHQITCQSGTPEPAPRCPDACRTSAANRATSPARPTTSAAGSREASSTIETYGWDTQPDRAIGAKARRSAQAALKVLDAAAAQDKPFFLFFHFWDPHTPYLPPAPFDRMFYRGDEKDPDNASMDALWQFESFNRYFAEWMPGSPTSSFPKAQYDAEIAYMDACFASVLTRLDELGLTGDTLLVSDRRSRRRTGRAWPLVRPSRPLRYQSPYPADHALPRPAARRHARRRPDQHARCRSYDSRSAGIGRLARRRGCWRRACCRLSTAPRRPRAARPTTLHITENTWMKKRGMRTPDWKLIVPLETRPARPLRGRALPPADDPGELDNVADEHRISCKTARQMDEHVPHAPCRGDRIARPPSPAAPPAPPHRGNGYGGSARPQNNRRSRRREIGVWRLHRL